MPRVAMEVDREKLERILARVEGGGVLASRMLVYEQVCSEYNQDNPPRQITPAIVAGRLKVWGTNVQTPLGKRGRPRKMAVAE